MRDHVLFPHVEGCWVFDVKCIINLNVVSLNSYWKNIHEFSSFFFSLFVCCFFFFFFFFFFC